MNFEFQKISREELLHLTSIREGETKLGQTMHTEYFDLDVQYVIIGVEESIGPQANFGNPGAENGFKAFLKRFLNMQSNRFLTGQKIAVLGSVKPIQNFQSIEQAKQLTEELDTFLLELLTPVFLAGKTVILIGGGHNNAYPLISALHKVTEKKVNVINLDPHSDCRKLEGRHSGNSFSYGITEGKIDNYSVLGLHKAYNSEFLLDFLEKNHCNFSFFDDYLAGNRSLHEDIENWIDRSSKKENIGIELDMDAIQFMPSSAYTPSGVSVEEARFFVSSSAKAGDVRYLHLPEAAPTNEMEDLFVGKVLAFLVWDFILNHSAHTTK